MVPEKKCEHIDCKCERKCFTLISEQQQKLIFKEYYDIKTREEQRFYLAKLMEDRPIKRRMVDPDDCKIIRNHTVAYHLRNELGENIRVCQLFFIKTFGISKKIPENIIKKLSPTTRILNSDHGNRGRAPKNKTDDLKIRKVKRFIQKFPKIPSHYCRKNSSKLYFYPELSLSKLYEMYCAETSEPQDIVRKHVFSSIFHAFEPPLAFFHPKKDQCTLCNTKFPEADYKCHIERKEAIYKAKIADKAAASEQADLVYATFDMEAVQCLPYCQDSSWYYKRKLSLYNFTIWDTKGNGLCNTWEEVNGAKSSVEVTSCVLDYLSSLQDSVKRVIFYCDTCGGQNRNFNIVCGLFYCMNSMQFNSNLETVELKYCESGHSYIEADSMHSAIENGRKTLKCYLPNDYQNIMKATRKNPKPYEVKPYSYQDFYDVRGLAKEFFVNRKKDTKKTKKINWLNVKVFRFVRNSKYVLFKYDVKSEEFEQETILRNSVKISDFGSFNLSRSAYQNMLPISIAKKRDLLDMLKEGVIPSIYRDYYQSLPSSKHVKDVAIWVTDAVGPQEERDLETEENADEEYEVYECEEISDSE